MAMLISDLEYQAVEAASDAAGEHLEKLGKTDLAQLTREEWLDFILTTYTAVCEQVRDLQLTDADIPY